MTRLSVNVNKVALLRNSRAGNVPSVVEAARAALQAGAHGITVHPRPDERHIRPPDVDDLVHLLREEMPGEGVGELNIEGNPFEGRYLQIVRKARPDQCTLVPDAPGQSTSDHGWDMASNTDRLSEVIGRLHEIGTRVSLFMDPRLEPIERVPGTGADRIELYTEAYARAYAIGRANQNQTYEAYHAAAVRAHDLGLAINAGHDLNLTNLGQFVTIPHIAEVSIGHALIAQALHDGLRATIRAYLDVLENHA